MSTKSLEERVVQLEELVSHQERLVDEINGVLVALRAEHDQLKKTVDMQLRSLESKLEAQGNPFDPNEKPPHY